MRGREGRKGRVEDTRDTCEVEGRRELGAGGVGARSYWLFFVEGSCDEVEHDVLW